MAMARCRMGVAQLPAPADVVPVDRVGMAGAYLTQAGRDLSAAATSLQYMNDCLTAQGWSPGPAR
jgi:hypothetical protein